MQLAMALTTEPRNMPALSPRDAQERRKGARKGKDTVRPYRSGFGRESWVLRPGSSRCVCMACWDGFNSVTAFERHQVLDDEGNAVCRDPARLGMVRNADGWWITKSREVER